MQDPNQELQQDTQEDIRYMESAEEHESKPSAGDEPNSLVPVSPKNAPVSVSSSVSGTLSVNNTETPNLNQLSHLVSILNEIEEISKKYELIGDNDFTDYLWDTVLPSITMKQYKFLLALAYNEETAKLTEVMDSLSFPRHNQYEIKS